MPPRRASLCKSASVLVCSRVCRYLGLSFSALFAFVSASNFLPKVVQLKSESLWNHSAPAFHEKPCCFFHKVLPKFRGAWPPRELGAAIATLEADGRRAKQKLSWQSACFLFACLSAPQLNKPCGAVGPPYPCPQQPRFSGWQEVQRKMSGPAWWGHALPQRECPCQLR